MTSSTNTGPTEDERVRVLVVDDDAEEVARIQEMLARCETAAFDIAIVDDMAAAVANLRDGSFDVVLLGLRELDDDAESAAARKKIAASGVPILALGSADDEDNTMQAIQEEPRIV